MRAKRIQVRRDRPGALALALAFAVTMLVVYLMTLGSAAEDARNKPSTRSSEPRVTRELTLEPLAVYCVQFGRFSGAGEARVEAARYAERGAAGYVYADGAQFLTLGAGYPERSDAERVAERLREREGLAAQVFARSCDAVRLKITAPEDQIETFLRADALLRAQVNQLGELAFQIDRGEIGAEAARALVAVQAAEARELLAELAEIPGENAIFAGLTARVEKLSAELNVLSFENIETDLFISGKIKYNYLDARLGYIDFLRSLD